MRLAEGTRLGPYEVLAPIGAGGMGEVYRARDTRLGREVAIKVLPAAYSNDPERLERFEQEARAAGMLNHPNIMAIYDIGAHDGSPYVVSELLEGETLRELLAPPAGPASPLPPRKATDYMIQLAHGLAAAHQKGIVHRDLKPENIFLTTEGRLKILDFGLAKLAQSAAGLEGEETALTAGLTQPGVVLGTMGYMSPEQVRGRLVGRDDERDSERRSAGALGIGPEHPAGARADRPSLPRKEPGGAVPVRTRSGVSSRGSLDAVRRERRTAGSRQGTSAPSVRSRRAGARGHDPGCGVVLRRQASRGRREGPGARVPAADLSKRQSDERQVCA